jgi:hypothetical protein
MVSNSHSTHFVLPGSRRASPGASGGFPQGLGGVYKGFFERYFPDLREYAAECRPAPEAICAVREPLERRDLALLLKVARVRDAFANCEARVAFPADVRPGPSIGSER